MRHKGKYQRDTEKLRAQARRKGIPGWRHMTVPQLLKALQPPKREEET